MTPENIARNRRECIDIVENLHDEITALGGIPVVRSAGEYSYIEINTPHDFPRDDVKPLMDEVYDRIPDKFITHTSLPEPKSLGHRSNR